MKDSNTQKIYSEHLEVFHSYFNNSESSIIKSSEIFGADSLINFSKNKEGGIVNVNFSFVPYMMEHLEKTCILQIFSQINEIEYDGNNKDVNQILSEINRLTSVGTFSHANKNIYFKYMYIFPLMQIPDKEAFLEIENTFLINYNYFGKMIRKSLDLTPKSINEVKKGLNII